MFNEQLGAKLAGYRRMANISQKTLAEKLDVTPKGLAGYEKGRTEISFRKVLIACMLLGITPDELLNDEVMAWVNYERGKA